MSSERHHWKPAVQAAAAMLRTPPVDGQSPASEPRPLAIYGVQCWERLRHPPVTNQQRAHTPCKLGFALCCHSNATHAPIANPPNSAQLGSSLYQAPKLHPGLLGNVVVRPRTDTQTRVTTIHSASSTTHAKCKQQLTVELLINVCISLCTAVIHNTAVNSCDNLPSHPPVSHHSSLLRRCVLQGERDLVNAPDCQTAVRASAALQSSTE